MTTDRKQLHLQLIREEGKAGDGPVLSGLPSHIVLVGKKRQ